MAVLHFIFKNYKTTISMKEKYLNRYPHYNGKYVNDGIINEELFRAQKQKVLFIAKEPNNPNQQEGDYTEWWKEGPKYSFSINIAVWAYGILNDFPAYINFIEKGELLKEALQSIAFMNVKKIGGASVSKYAEISEHIEQNRDLLEMQIKSINPDIIISCLGDGKLNDALYGNLIWKDAKCGVKFSSYNHSQLIDFYHPSARMPNMASYALLKEIVNEIKPK